MKIIWDEPKRLSNLVKHDLDFADIEEEFDFDGAIVLPAKPSRTGLAQFRLIGELRSALLVAIVGSTLGSEAIRSSVFVRRVKRNANFMTAKHAPGYVPNPNYTQEDWDEVSDNPEWTAEDFAKARPFVEVFPELAEKIRRARGPQKAPTKALVSLRIDKDILERFKADGPGWQSRINDALRKAIQG